MNTQNSLEESSATMALFKSLFPVAEYKIDLSLVPMLISIIKEDKGEARVKALGMCWNLSVAAENKVPMAAVELGLLRLLVEVIKEDKGEARVKALGMCWNLSSAAENKVPMAAVELGLLRLLVEVIKEGKGEARVKALGMCWNLSVAAENKVPMAAVELGLLRLLVEVIKEGKGEARVKALGVCRNLSIAAENKVHMAAVELGLLRLLLELIKENKSEARAMALGVCWNLSSAAENKVPMAAVELGLLRLLVEVIKEDKGEARVKALGACWNLSAAAENKVPMAAVELGLLPLLVEVIKEDKGEARVKALGVCRNLSAAAENKVQMAAVELGLLRLLVELIKEDKGRARVGAVKIIWQLSVTANSDVLLACGDIDLLAMVMEVTQEDNFDCKISAVKLLCSSIIRSQKVSHIVLQDVAMELAAILAKLLLDKNLSEAEQISVYSPLWNFVELFGAECVPAMVQYKIPELVVREVQQAGCVAAEWKRSKICSYVLNYAMNLARHDVAVDVMIAAGYLDVVYPILANPANGCERMKAMYIVAFLAGKDEQCQHKSSIAVQHPDIMPHLVTILENTLNGVGGADHPLGTFCLRLTLNAYQVLSTSDSNKEVLITLSLLPLLVRALHMFVDNAAPIRLCGGGGEDAEAAELAVGTLVQLSFCYETDAALQAKYLSVDRAIVELLVAFSNNAAVHDYAKDNANLLVRRLTATSAAEPSTDTSQKPAPSSNTKASHIMLSYCWNATAKPELVKQLHTELTVRGFDVWLDAVGSSIVPAMGGNTDERMAEAIEAAQVVIMCVSAIYKERPNCRMEAKYANQLYKKGRLQIYYVMMQPDYTTVSEPNCCDGWLGIQIGDALWYPLWAAEVVQSTVESLISHIGDRCKLSGSTSAALTNAPESPSAAKLPTKLRNSISAAAPAMELTRDEICIQAWEILTNAKKVLSVTDMESCLEGLGVMEAGDLMDCEREVLVNLSTMLKPVPKKKFEKLMIDAQ